MEFDPGLHQPQLFARYLAGQYLGITNVDRGFKLPIAGVYVGQVVMLVIQQDILMMIP